MKYIFVSGGVLSGLGKGVTAASLGVTLQARGYKVTNIKFENYLNLDASSINPIEHGDIFLCEDGTQADLDLGTYERFLNQNVGHKNYCTIGQLYKTMIERTANLEFKGKTVDAIPYIPEEIISRINQAAEGFDIILIELGGCAGEYQNSVYYEANRILKLQHPGDVLHVHVTYFPHPKHIGELKSKPTQLSVKNLNEMGIQPDFIVGRAEEGIDEKRKEKVAYYCNLTPEDIISNPDGEIYELPLVFEKQNFASKALEKLRLENKEADLSAWKNFLENLEKGEPNKVPIHVGTNLYRYETNLSIGFVLPQKMTESEADEALTSIWQAIRYAQAKTHQSVGARYLRPEDDEEKYKNLQGIIILHGDEDTQDDNLLQIVNYCRDKKLPILGIGQGMEVMVASELKTTISEAIAKTEPVLGAVEVDIPEGSWFREVYPSGKASERHRNHYVVKDNDALRDDPALDLVYGEHLEFIARKDHPFFVGTMGLPEYKSRPLQPHPLFVKFFERIVETSGSKPYTDFRGSVHKFEDLSGEPCLEGVTEESEERIKKIQTRA